MGEQAGRERKARATMSTPWFHLATFYAVDLAHFQDSNGDGIGDLDGSIARLDYLADLGFTAVWLLPFYPSSGGDNGYDITDYRNVDERFGTFESVRKFVDGAHRRGIRVIFDLVAHHTSDQHPWFLAARESADSPYRDYYVWSSTKPVENQPVSIFPGVEEDVWEWDERAQAYYFHRFYRFQPDLNFANPAVQNEMLEVARFWMDFGIDGFRLDAANHLFEQKGIPGTEIDDPCDFLGRLLSVIRERNPEGIVVAEADVEPEEFVQFTCDGNGITLFSNFLMNNRLFLGITRESAIPFVEGFRETPGLPPPCEWLNFLRNLDEIDLERLSDEEREDVFERLAPEERMRVYGRGIRRRLAPLLDGRQRRLRMLFSLLFSHPGVPLVVYGDEIGMGDNLDLSERLSVHLPMQWTAEPRGGFTSPDAPEMPIAPVADGPFGYRTVNVAAQLDDPDSLLAFIRRLNQCRAEHPSIHSDTMRIDTCRDGRVMRTEYPADHDALLVFHNFSDRVEHRLLSDLPEGARLILHGHATAIESDRSLTLGPYGYCWLDPASVAAAKRQTASRTAAAPANAEIAHSAAE